MQRYIYYVLLPLAIGTLPYLFLRRDEPVFVITMQRIFKNYIGLDFNQRQLITLDAQWNWIIFNLPDALWAFSLTSFIMLATRTDSRNIKLLYLFVSIVIILILEITVGTFDWLDLAAMFIGSCASITLMRRELRNE